MPTYEYECLKCKYIFEKFQGIKEEPLKKCPKCGGKVKRLIGTGAGIIFKGKGFYHTDYKISSKDSIGKRKSEISESKNSSKDKD